MQLLQAEVDAVVPLYMTLAERDEPTAKVLPFSPIVTPKNDTPEIEFVVQVSPSSVDEMVSPESVTARI